MKKCIIIGSGLGGLSTGVILAKNGYKVTILEQASQIGGCLQCFHREGAKFETGMHFIGSLNDGQVLSNYFNYLEIMDKVELRQLDIGAYNVVRINGRNYAFPNGREAFIERFSKYFPSQRENIIRYCDLVERIAATSPLYDLSKEPTTNLFFDDELLFSSINEVLDKTISDPLLRDVLVGDLPLYAAQKDRTSFATHAYIADFYNKGAFRVVGGSDNVAKALLEVLTKYGGHVITSKKVVKINVEEKVAKGVVTEDGNKYEADIVISDIHPSQLVDLVEEHVFTNAYTSRIKTISNTVAAFSLYLRFKEGTMPYMNHNLYSYSSGSPWDMDGSFDKKWPKGYLYMHHCHNKYSDYAEAGVVMTYLTMDVFKKWDGTKIGRRGAEYEHLKKELSERLLDAVERDFPNIREKIAGYYSATPLTYQDYTFTPDGSIYGLTKDVSAGAAGRVSFKTKVTNLFMVGQNINSHGMLGVLVSSLRAGSHIVGEEGISRQMYLANRKKALIIGGGLGGLFTGALLTKEGFHVIVLEKNKTIGGGLQTFKRDGLTFDTGMHMLGGLRYGSAIHMILTYLGIFNQLKIRHSDSDCMDCLKYIEDGKTYCIPEGREAFTEYFIKEFPHEEKGIRDYVDAMYRLSNEIDLFYMRPTDDMMTQHSEQFLWSADELISYYIKDEHLRDILAYMNPMYGGIYGHTPAYIHAIINVLYIAGQDRFIGNSQQMADSLEQLIVKGGGQVLTNKKVSAINVDDGHYCTSVSTANGGNYSADYYISAIHPQSLVNLVGPIGFSKSYRLRVASISNTYSAFIVFIKFHPGIFPYINHTCYYQDKYGKVWKHGEYDPNDEEWPHGFMYMTPADEQSDYATKMIINCLMPFSAVKQWENTQTGNRGKDYEQWKQRNVDLIINRMEQLHPGFHDTIDKVWSASPLTIRDYYGQPEGALYGIQKDCKDIMLSRLPIGTKVKNLFLTGQNINLHGFCGVPLTAINTVEALIGQNKLVNKINQLYGKYGV